MSSNKLEGLSNPHIHQRLENHLYIGLCNKDTKVFLHTVGFEMNLTTQDKIGLGSDKLADYLSIQVSGQMAEFKFNDVPYSVFDPHFLQMVQNPEDQTFSFYGWAELDNKGNFSYNLNSLNDPLGLLNKIWCASFTFTTDHLEG